MGIERDKIIVKCDSLHCESVFVVPGVNEEVIESVIVNKGWSVIRVPMVGIQYHCSKHEIHVKSKGKIKCPESTD